MRREYKVKIILLAKRVLKQQKDLVKKLFTLRRNINLMSNILQNINLFNDILVIS